MTSKSPLIEIGDVLSLTRIVSALTRKVWERSPRVGSPVMFPVRVTY